jgi:hypothetical protein
LKHCSFNFVYNISYPPTPLTLQALLIYCIPLSAASLLQLFPPSLFITSSFLPSVAPLLLFSHLSCAQCSLSFSLRLSAPTLPIFPSADLPSYLIPPFQCTMQPLLIYSSFPLLPLLFIFFLQSHHSAASFSPHLYSPIFGIPASL